MKSIQDIVEAKSAPLKKLYLLTIMIPYQMWKEYGAYDSFFKNLDEKSQKRWDDLVKYLTDLDENNSRVQFSALKMYFPILNDLADYVLTGKDDDFGKADIKIWEEIKNYI